MSASTANLSALPTDVRSVRDIRPAEVLEKGLERDPTISEKKVFTSSQGEAEPVDPFCVTWDGPDDPQNPYNWPYWRRFLVVLLVSLGSMLTMMSSTVMAPALNVISQDLHTGAATTQMTLSVFVLAYVVGPMVLAPLSEVYGRKPVWLVSVCLYILWNTVCGFANSNGLMIAGRFFAGLGASVQYAIEKPVLADCWKPDQRGLAFSIATFFPLFGPAVGPIIGGVLTGSIGWRWLFWVLSIFDAAIVTVTFFFFPETYSPIILKRKAKTLRKQTGQDYYADHERQGPTIIHVLAKSLARPWRLLLTDHLIQLMSIYLAYNYGVLYIVQSTFATLWTDRYHQSVSISGLHYIAIALGCMMAAQGGAHITDRVWMHLKKKAKGEVRPEYRVPLMIPGNVLITVGLFWYGWTAQARVFWIVPDIGIAIFSCGIILSTQAMQQYVIDAFPKHVASAQAASQLPRNITGFAFPLFAPALYHKLGYGWGNSLLAFVFVAISAPAPLVLWKFGARMRGEKSEMVMAAV